VYGGKIIDDVHVLQRFVEYANGHETFTASNYIFGGSRLWEEETVFCGVEAGRGGGGGDEVFWWIGRGRGGGLDDILDDELLHCFQAQKGEEPPVSVKDAMQLHVSDDVN